MTSLSDHLPSRVIHSAQVSPEALRDALAHTKLSGLDVAQQTKLHHIQELFLQQAEHYGLSPPWYSAQPFLNVRPERPSPDVLDLGKASDGEALYYNYVLGIPTSGTSREPRLRLGSVSLQHIEAYFRALQTKTLEAFAEAKHMNLSKGMHLLMSGFMILRGNVLTVLPVSGEWVTLMKKIITRHKDTLSFKDMGLLSAYNMSVVGSLLESVVVPKVSLDTDCVVDYTTKAFQDIRPECKHDMPTLLYPTLKERLQGLIETHGMDWDWNSSAAVKAIQVLPRDALKEFFELRQWDKPFAKWFRMERMTTEVKKGWIQEVKRSSPEVYGLTLEQLADENYGAFERIFIGAMKSAKKPSKKSTQMVEGIMPKKRRRETTPTEAHVSGML